MLREIESAPSAAVPLEAFAAHLRLAEGFGDEDPAGLDVYARAASAAVEGMTGLALIQRRFLWTVTAWADPGAVRLPIGPAARLNALTLVRADGGWEAVDGGATRLVPDAFRPRLSGARGRSLPAIPAEGRAEVEILAGFGPDWAAVPEELRQAVLMLGAHWHEQRHVAGDPAREAPMGVRAIVARWREPRL